MNRKWRMMIGILFILFALAGCEAIDPLQAQGVSNFDQLVLEAAAEPALDVTGSCIDLDADNDTSICSDTDDQIDFELGGADVFRLADAPDAGAGGDLLDITDGLAIMNGSDTVQGIDLNLTGANHTGTANVIVGLGLNLATADDQALETAIVIDGSWDIALDVGDLPVISTSIFMMNDFLGDTLLAEWDYDSGSTAADCVLTNAQFGTCIATTHADSAFSDDHVGIDLGSIPISMDQGSVVFEIRLQLSDITTQQTVSFGFTDTETAEAWGTVSGDTWTITADDTIAFSFDDNATTDEWFALATDSVGGDATGIGATGTAPTDDTYQTLRIVVNASTDEAFFYIDGVLVATLTGDVVLETTLMTPFFMMDNTGGAVDVVRIDYIAFWADRN